MRPRAAAFHALVADLEKRLTGESRRRSASVTSFLAALRGRGVTGAAVST